MEVHSENRPLRASSGSADKAEDRPEIRVLLASPRGFCAGVRRAIDAVRDALAMHGAPVYVRRAIVHNLDVVRTLEEEGAIFVEELEAVPGGGVVILSAHGVSPAVAADAQRRGHIAYDAVCPLVSKVHREVERHDRSGRQLILIGHKGHPEIEGTLGYVTSASACVVKSVDEVADLELDRAAPTAYAVQTTYSVDEAEKIIAALVERFADLIGPPSSDICYATTNRQVAVREVAARADAVIVVGEKFSSNANRLAEVAETLCPSVQLVAGVEGIDWSRLPQSGAIGLTAAASTPETVVQAIIAALEVRYRLILEEVEVLRETTVFSRLKIA